MLRISQALMALLLMGLQLSSLTSSFLRAQEPGAAGLEIVELSGKLDAILGNQIKLKSEDGKESVVLVGNETTFSYKGTAEPSALSAGQMVRFTAAFDAAGNPQAPLTQLEVFTPVRAGRRLSLELRQKQTPGIYPTSDKPNGDKKVDQTAQSAKVAGNSKPTEKAVAKPVPSKGTSAKNSPAVNARDKDKNAKASASQANKTGATTGAVQDYLVVGMLRAVQGEKLQIFAGNRPVIVSAGASMKITVSAGDPVFCLPGDEIKLTGLKSPQGLIQADAIEVTGAKPLGSVDEKAQARNKRTKPGEKDKDAEKEKDKAATKGNTAEKAKPK